jgi:phytoene dehydrogenase-like protein
LTQAKQFDVVIIGSGLGGVTAGALLAKQGYGVCLLERNFSLGGAASVYKVGGLTVEASLHQTSDPRNPRDPKRRILDELGILDEIEFVSTGPLYTVKGGPLDAPFALPAGFEAAKDALSDRFPAQAKPIARFLDQLDAIQDSLWNLSGADEIAKPARGLAADAPAAADWRSSLAEVFAREFGDAEGLKAALAANLFYFGDDPARMWFVYYALTQGSNIGCGGAYIKGGSRQLSLKLAKSITKAGGVVRLGRSASAIEIDSDGKASAVRHVNRRNGEEEERIEARLVLANCSPNVAGALLPESARAALLREFGERPLSTSLFCAHFGMNEKPSSIGLADYSTILLPDDLTRFDQYSASGALLSDAPKGPLPAMGIANFTAVDSGLWDAPPMLLSVLGLDRMSNWTNLTRDESKARRELWLDAVLARLESEYPGLSALVQERTLLNAHSMAGYLNTPDGAVYGFAPLPPEGPIEGGFPRTPRTSVPGLYLASAFGGEHGFNGAMLSGAETAKLAARALASGR